MANVRSTIEATNVVNVQFKKLDSSSTQRPRFEYALKFNRNGVNTIKYGSVTVRTPTTMPASQS
jgi:hypothetical protein